MTVGESARPSHVGLVLYVTPGSVASDRARQAVADAVRDIPGEIDVDLEVVDVTALDRDEVITGHQIVATPTLVREWPPPRVACVGATLHGIRALFALRDVTDRPEPATVPAAWAPSALDVPAERLAALVEAANDAIISVDSHGFIEIWNAAASLAYGYRPDEVIGRPISMLAPPDVAAQVELLLEAVRRGDRVDSVDALSLRRDGTRVPLSISLSPIFDSRGEVSGASVVGRDLSAEQRLMRRLEMRERAAQELAAIVQSSPDAILSATSEGADLTIASWNRGAERLFGYTEDEAVGMPVSRLVPERIREQYERESAKMQRGVPVRFDARRIRKDGVEIDVEVAAAPTVDEQGRMIGSAAIVHDIGPRLAREVALREAEGRYRTLFEASPIGIFVAHAVGREVIYTNPALWELLGGDAEGSGPQGILDLHPPEHHSRMLALLGAIVRGETNTAKGVPLLRSDGAVVQADLTVGRARILGKDCLVGYLSRIERSEAGGTRLEYGDLAIDPFSREVMVAGEQVVLTSREFDLLFYLASSPKRVFSREQLLAHAWHSSSEWQDVRSVTEFIRRVRQKIDVDPTRPSRIVTVRGAGYRFEP